MPRMVVLYASLTAASFAFGDDAVRFETARVHLQKGRYEEALGVYAELASQGADRAKIALGRSRALQSQGKWTRATEVLEAAVKSAPESALLWARLADVQFRQGRYTDAEQPVAEAMKRDQKQPLAHLVRADLFTETGRLKQAEKEYRWFVQYYNSAQPKDAETLLLVARGAAQYARWNSVPQILDFVVNTLCPDALKSDEHSWQAYYISGSLLLEKYNRAQALPEFRQALSVNPRAAEVLVSLGNASLDQHDLDEAEEFAERALKINPHLVVALWLKADVNLAAGRTSEALCTVKKALAVNPSDQRTLARAAACYLLQDSPPPEEQLSELLSNLDSIGNVSIEDPGRFATLLWNLAKRNPRPGYFLTQLGRTLDARRKYDVAERLYKAAIAAMPQLADPKTALGMLYMRIGKTEEAGKILDDAFQADPYHVRVSNMRKVLKLLSEYQTMTTEHFVIHVDAKADAVLGRYMAEYLEEIYGELVKQYGFEPPGRTHFEIYHDGKGLTAHQWFSARMVGLPWIQTVGASTGMIVALASPTAAGKPFNWAKVLKHEFVHVITLQQTRFNIPHWFTEALAVSSEGYPRPALWNKLLLERVPNGELRNLDTLNEGFVRPKSPEDWQFTYCQSQLYAQYMTKRYGPKSIRKLLDAYRRNLSTDRAIKAVFGVDKETFEKGYRDDLNRLVEQLQNNDPEPQKTLSELEEAHLAETGKLKAALETVARMDADDPVVRKKLAQISLEQKAYAETLKYGKMALHIDVLDAETHRILAEAHRGLGQLRQAIDEYRVSLEIEPGNNRLELALAQTHLAAGQNAEAKSRLENILKRDPDHAEARTLLKKLD